MRRIKGLDSLRLFAIVLIVIYHISRETLPGGFVAVEIFFLLSGYLIAMSLMKAAEKKGLSLWRFLVDRIKRLYPALLACVIFALTLGFFVEPDIMTQARTHTLEALTFSTNIVEIETGGSYEAQMFPSVFEHLWFLAQLFQLYLVLFVIVWLSTRFGKKIKRQSRAVSAVCFVLGVVSYVLMALYGYRYGAETRAYFGTDTHAGAFLIGAGIYGLMYGLAERKVAVWRKVVYALAIIASASATIWLSIVSEYSSPNTFIFALPMAGVLSAILVYAIVRIQGGAESKKQPSKLAKFGAKILSFGDYLGTLSFYVYLFHWSLFILLPSLINFEQSWLMCVVVSLASLALAFAMQYGVMPFFAWLWKGKWYKKVVALFAFAGLCVLPVFTLLKAPDQSSVELQLEEMNALQDEDLSEASGDASEPEELHIDFAKNEELMGDLNAKIGPYIALTKKYAYVAPTKSSGGYSKYGNNKYSGSGSVVCTSLNGKRYLLIGDSVTLGAKDAIYNKVSSICVDAYGSRGLSMRPSHSGSDRKYEGGYVFGDYVNYAKKNGKTLPHVIIFSLITNARGTGDISATIDYIVKTGGPDHQYVFVTGYCASSKCTDRSPQNNVLWKKANQYSNVHVADWYSIAKKNHGNRSFFQPDNTHLSTNGKTAYANLIKNAVSGL